MMRLLLVACLLFSANCFANDYILVSGQGRTLDQAKENAFREAIQIKAGTIVVSERESTIRKILRDDISVYSAGYVTDYKILSINDLGPNIIVNMNVLVKESKLLNQVLSTGKTVNLIDGDNDATRYNTYIDQKNRGDRLLSVVMNTYPKNAYILTQGNYKILVDSYRNGILEIPYTIRWNFDFIRSFNEAMTLLQDSNFGWLDQAPANIKTGHRTHFKFNDVILLKKTKEQFIYDKEMVLKLNIKDNNLFSLYQMCYTPGYRGGSFFALGEPKEFRIFDNMSDTGVIRTTINSDIIKQAVMLELSVTSYGECQKILR